MHSYKAYDVHEFSFDYGGNNYLVIYGSHINGGFIAIPNWNISVEACDTGEWNEVYYNADALYSRCKGDGFSEKVSLEVAKEVNKHYEKYLKSVSAENGVWLHFGPAGKYVENGKIKGKYIEGPLPKVYYYFDDFGNTEIQKYVEEEEMKELAEKRLKERKGLSL